MDYLPSTKDAAGQRYRSRNRNEIVRETDDKAPLSCYAFKIASDKFVGTLTFIRIYSGTLSSASYITNTRTGKTERLGRLLIMHSNKREEIDEAGAGNIVAAVGLKDVKTGDTFAMASILYF